MGVAGLGWRLLDGVSYTLGNEMWEDGPSMLNALDSFESLCVGLCRFE